MICTGSAAAMLQKPLCALEDDPVHELRRILLFAWPEIAAENIAYTRPDATTLRRLTGVEVNDGDVIDWAIVEKVRDAANRKLSALRQVAGDGEPEPSPPASLPRWCAACRASQPEGWTKRCYWCDGATSPGYTICDGVTTG